VLAGSFAALALIRYVPSSSCVRAGRRLLIDAFLVRSVLAPAVIALSASARPGRPPPGDGLTGRVSGEGSSLSLISGSHTVISISQPRARPTQGRAVEQGPWRSRRRSVIRASSSGALLASHLTRPSTPNA
jgi:hypothetical protein